MSVKFTMWKECLEDQTDRKMQGMPFGAPRGLKEKLIAQEVVKTAHFG